jgi:hypothetical protein
LDCNLVQFQDLIGKLHATQLTWQEHKVRSPFRQDLAVQHLVTENPLNGACSFDKGAHNNVLQSHTGRHIRI